MTVQIHTLTLQEHHHSVSHIYRRSVHNVFFIWWWLASCVCGGDWLHVHFIRVVLQSTRVAAVTPNPTSPPPWGRPPLIKSQPVGDTQRLCINNHSFIFQSGSSHLACWRPLTWSGCLMRLWLETLDLWTEPLCSLTGHTHTHTSPYILQSLLLAGLILDQ